LKVLPNEEFGDELWTVSLCVCTLSESQSDIDRRESPRINWVEDGHSPIWVEDGHSPIWVEDGHSPIWVEDGHSPMLDSNRLSVDSRINKVSKVLNKFKQQQKKLHDPNHTWQKNRILYVHVMCTDLHYMITYTHTHTYKKTHTSPNFQSCPHKREFRRLLRRLLSRLLRRLLSRLPRCLLSHLSSFQTSTCRLLRHLLSRLPRYLLSNLSSTQTWTCRPRKHRPAVYSDVYLAVYPDVYLPSIQTWTHGLNQEALPQWRPSWQRAAHICMLIACVYVCQLHMHVTYMCTKAGKTYTCYMMRACMIIRNTCMHTTYIS
jgi:hypothetical protein